ncbi:serine hydrolase domain-containing protein [Streptomyces sp. TG1A-8]|uniref:serine hydrolase domain-containing protein n=1 Tax=Streptomyces sp. TG1A-8 TaxID=3051385 RepID=UPI00265BFC81|nr:serine hydrolase domain-containing protein [Streptomyces sp. TG1A-8]MDO0924741.1 serine hydrolase domain-containing protein [Streptomyces sp. TG1A-8]
MRIPAYFTATALLAALANPASATAGTVASPGSTAARVAHHDSRFDRPHTGFAPADTVLHPGSPGRAGLDPAPIEAFQRALTTWEDPASGANHLFPGATSLMVHDGTVVHRSASGYAVKYADATTELPADQWVPARTDTIYDLASLSKLFTSLLAVQQLEAGRLDLDTPVAHYLPGFERNGKDGITVGQLLTHTSGFGADPVPSLWKGYPDVPSRRQAILDAKPVNRPGTTYLYSDLNMLGMQLVLEKVTGEPLDALVRERITGPLHMTDTGYNPPASELPRIAATEYEADPARGMVRGSVHDENAWSLGGVAGHAGVFSTVDDLAVLAQAILNGGVYRGHRILGERGVELMERNFNQAFPDDSHGLGFELDQIWYMGGLSGPGTLGHTGFTGTSLVIDPASRSFVILLTNRVHPTRSTPSTNAARREIAQALAKALPVEAPGHGRSWYSGQAGDTTSTLTTGGLTASGPVGVDFTTFVNTEPTDRLVLEASTGDGGTWSAVPLRATGTGAPSGEVPALSGQAVRAWWKVHAEVPQAGGGVRLRWRYTTDHVYEGRGVNLAGIEVTDGSRILLDGDRPHAALTSDGWRRLPAHGRP